MKGKRERERDRRKNGRCHTIQAELLLCTSREVGMPIRKSETHKGSNLSVNVS